MIGHTQLVQIPRVTIGIPVHNGEKYIREALDSVVAQTFEDYEVIISDNASDDGTQSICTDYRDRYPRMTYVRQHENIGVYENFRFVTYNATGKFITWLAHDDALMPGFLEETVRYMSQHAGTVLVASDFEIIDDEGATLGIELLTRIRDHLSWRRRCAEFFKFPSSNVFYCIYGLMMADTLKSGLRSVGAPAIGDGSEMPILARLAVEGEIASIPIVLRKYRRHNSSFYLREVAEIASMPILRRTSIRSGNSYRIRLDQMTVLWSSPSSKFFKWSISTNALLFYSQFSLARVVRFSLRMFTAMKSSVMGFLTELQKRL